MIALLLAGALASANGLPISPPTACKGSGAMQTSYADPALLLRPQDRAAVRMLKLGDLPKANLEIAVERSVGGCAAPVVIGYQVERDGHFATGAGK